MISLNKTFVIITLLISVLSLNSGSFVHDECGVSPTMLVAKLANQFGLSRKRMYQLIQTKYPKEYALLKIRESRFYECVIISDLSQGGVISG